MKKTKKIFAVVGMCGSGKTEVVNYLQEKYRWPKIYFPESLFEEIEKRGMETNWESEEFMRKQLREEQGPGVFAKLALPKIKKELANCKVVILESLYSWTEYKIIKKAYPDYFRVIAVVAPPALRFSRLQNRKKRPIKKYSEFEDRDCHEIENAEKGGPIAIADHTIINDGTMKSLQKKIDEIVRQEGLKRSYKTDEKVEIFEK